MWLHIIVQIFLNTQSEVNTVDNTSDNRKRSEQADHMCKQQPLSPKGVAKILLDLHDKEQLIINQENQKEVLNTLIKVYNGYVYAFVSVYHIKYMQGPVHSLTEEEQLAKAAQVTVGKQYLYRGYAGGVSFSNYHQKIICVGHFECMITVTHNTFYNSQLFFSALNMNFATDIICFSPNLTYIGVKAVTISCKLFIFKDHCIMLITLSTHNTRVSQCNLFHVMWKHPLHNLYIGLVVLRFYINKANTTSQSCQIYFITSTYIPIRRLLSVKHFYNINLMPSTLCVSVCVLLFLYMYVG